MTTATKTYTCKHCAETFSSPVRLGGHVHAAHPEHRRRPPQWMRIEPVRPSRPNLKRPTDVWPGKP